jgi:hypothetical protein
MLFQHCQQANQVLCNGISNALLPFMVGQSHDRFTLLRVKNVMLLQYCSKISQETLLNSISNHLLPGFMVGQSHDSFTLLSVKNVMVFLALSAGQSSAV